MGKSVIAICVGASLGALLRWWLGHLLNGLFPTIPLGTLVGVVVNEAFKVTNEIRPWVAERIMAQDLDALVDFMEQAPAPLLAHPNPDHYLPLLVVAGLAAERGMAPRFELEGFEYGSISRRSVRFG